jgi:hypothetical protein
MVLLSLKPYAGEESKPLNEELIVRKVIRVPYRVTILPEEGRKRYAEERVCYIGVEIWGAYLDSRRRKCERARGSGVGD